MATNDNKPVIVLIHGAWHRPSHYPENPSSGEAADSKGKTHLDDVAAIRESMEGPLTAGKDIVLVCHSYGGIPGSAAVEGYQAHERLDKGLQGGIKHVVYIAAFALPVRDLSLRMAVGGTYGDFMDRTDDVLLLNDNAQNTFYGDIDSEMATRMIANCVPQSTASLETPSSFVATDVVVPTTYMVCEKDRVIPVEGQMAMAGAMGETVRIEKLDSGHSPFLKPEILPQLVDIIERAAM
ncbi:hypothetical protein FZEAL_9092 [Fusarium zealandicum]|uniref:AB hydrolase-1 domain-containing protein n=1 Tax=Fusarium zealandicum TaxID=1053134 RepID=A0A8H4UD78_9HYPO|nr:hypothetical protein FZEAL_9092 [Fusarium zealandicum]